MVRIMISKIADTDGFDTQLNKTYVYNLAEERSAGSLDNELKFNKKKGEFQRKIVLNKIFSFIRRKGKQTLS